MVCNIMSGKIYKGSIAEITVPMFPKCYTGDTANLVVDFYVTGDTSIEFSVSAGSIVLDEYFNGTVVFQEAQLGVLHDGLLKYTTTCDEYLKEWETRYFICTPQDYTPVEYVTSEDVEEVVSEIIGDNYLTKDEAEETYAKITDIPSVSGYCTTAQVQSMITSATTGFCTSAEVQTTLSDYAKLTDIPSLDSYATKQYVDNTITASTQNMVTSSTINTIWYGTEEQYNNILIKDNNTLYIIA